MCLAGGVGTEHNRQRRELDVDIDDALLPLHPETPDHLDLDLD